jgi:type I restriction enzyme S subunit
MVQRWPTKKLGEIYENIKKEKASIGEVPYIEIGNIDVNNKKIILTYKGAVNGSIFAPENSILISRVRPTRGAVAFVDKKIAVSSAFTIIKPKADYNPKLLFYFLAWNKKFFDYLGERQKGTNYPSVREEDILEFEVALPENKEEQQKIVKILDTIQSAIEIQEKIIEKTKELKKSLMNLLFHYGLAGLRVKELASSRVGELTSSELEKLGLRLKKTEIGQIPEHWEVVRLEELALDFLGGGTPSTNVREYWDGEIPWTTSSIIEEGKVCILKNGQKYITKLGYENSSTQIVPAFNLLVGTRVGVGKVAINEIDIAINQDLTGIIYNREKINLFYFAYILTSPRCQGFFNSYKRGATIKGIPRSDLETMLIPLPPLPEQQEIAEILQTIDQKIEIEKKKKELYEELFKTLLNKIMNQEIDVNLLDY